MPLSGAAVEVASQADMRETETALPPLKIAMSPKTQPQMMRRLMSMESDYLRERNDRLYLRLVQGAKCSSTRTSAEHSFFQFPGMLDAFSMKGDKIDVTSVAETEFETETATTTAPLGGSRLFSPLPSPPAEAHAFQHQQQERLSQRDVYDEEPPPGYKRLKKIHSSRRHCWADTTVEAAKQPITNLDYVTHHPYRVSTGRYAPYVSQKEQEQHPQQQQVYFLGDGFSGDETKSRRTKRRVKSDNSSSNDTGCSHRKKKKCETSPILRSLEVISLSQEELAMEKEAAAAAAAAALRAATKTKEITRMIPLRPLPALPSITIWEFNADEPSLSRKENRPAVEDVLFVASSSDEDEEAVGDAMGEAASTHTLLPPLRRTLNQ